MIYTKASSAARSIKDYHMAKIDNRSMKVQYAMTLTAPANSQQREATTKRPMTNRIGKSGRGKTLNVMRA